MKLLVIARGENMSQLMNATEFSPEQLAQFSELLSNLTNGNQQNGLGNFQLGLNSGTLGLGLGAVQSIGNLWNSWNANRLARDQFNFTKDVTNTNLNNQIQSYNTALADRANTRAQANSSNFTSEDASNYIRNNSLSR